MKARMPEGITQARHDRYALLVLQPLAAEHAVALEPFGVRLPQRRIVYPRTIVVRMHEARQCGTVDAVGCKDGGIEVLDDIAAWRARVART